MSEDKANNTSSFRSRQRPTKARKRRKSDTVGHNEESGNQPTKQNSDSDPEPNAFLFKQAQQLREKNRLQSSSILDLNQPSSSENQPPDKQNSANMSNTTGNDVASSLHVSFSVERSGLALEQNLDRYVELGMTQKFGRTNLHSDSKPANFSEDEGEFDIPASLRVNEKPAYDPGEGLPAAGVEEINAPDPALEHKQTRNGQNPYQSQPSRPRGQAHLPGDSIPSNLSTNFNQHRKKWIERNLPIRDGNNQNVQSAEGISRGRSAQSKREAPPTDASFAEKFRKRWRQH